MKMELLRMKHARALTGMRIAGRAAQEAELLAENKQACDALERFEEHAKQAEADLEKLIAESQPVTKN
jgi:hypothetical protein